ncbi:MAG: DUF3168 domain-containing protein [Gemmobacter sp.]
MPDGPALALQAALIARLRAHPAVASIVAGRVHDEPPQDVAFPHVRLGVFDLAPLRLSGACTDEDIRFSVECHSRPLSGRVEVARLARAVREALDDAPLAVTGWRVDWCVFTAEAVSRAADGRGYIAVLAFEAALGAP